MITQLGGMIMGGVRQRFAKLKSLLLASAVALPYLATTAPTRAEIIPVEEMLRGTRVTYAQCATKGSTVWVAAFGREFCVRYYLSTEGGQGQEAVVFLQGDKLGRLDGKTRTFDPPPEKRKDVDTANLDKSAARMSKRAGVPAIYLARIGVDGSSGHHSARKTYLELHVINAALDAIKRRHGFRTIHLVGQSGGAQLVGGLLALRRDIGCAVPGSGPLSWRKRPREMGELTVFDPSDAIPQIAQSSSARILVVTDPDDQVVSVDSQRTFVARLRKAGGRAHQIFVRALDEKRHGTVAYSLAAAAECLAGKSDQEIEAVLLELSEKRFAEAQKRKMRKARESAAPETAGSPSDPTRFRKPARYETSPGEPVSRPSNTGPTL